MFYKDVNNKKYKMSDYKTIKARISNSLSKLEEMLADYEETATRKKIMILVQRRKLLKKESYIMNIFNLIIIIRNFIAIIKKLMPSYLMIIMTQLLIWI